MQRVARRLEDIKHTQICAPERLKCKIVAAAGCIPRVAHRPEDKHTQICAPERLKRKVVGAADCLPCAARRPADTNTLKFAHLRGSNVK